MRPRSLGFFCTIALVWIAGCAEPGLPPLVASSRYIDFHTDVDASVACMDDFLAREDRFVEAVAEVLGVAVPGERVGFVWNPEEDASDAWACETAVDCYRYDEERGTGLVVSRSVANRHELVHAVEVPALGQTGSKVLGEGLAEYLGSGKSTLGVVAGFPAALEAMIANGELDYLLALHFVGSLVEQYGAERYRAFRTALPGDAGLQQFAAVFESIYERPWSEALAGMDAPIRGRERPPGCGEGPVLPWTGEGILETTIVSQCGDGTFFGAGVVDGQPAFEATFRVQISNPGRYEFTIQGPVVEGILTGCSVEATSQSIGSHAGLTTQGLMQPGEHVLRLRFPANDEPRGEATVRLEYASPQP